MLKCPKYGALLCVVFVILICFENWQNWRGWYGTDGHSVPTLTEFCHY